MMKRLLLLLLLPLLTGCAALPAEERAFAVALAVTRQEEDWLALARIPTYQSGGGYATVTGQGVSLEAALTALDAAAPMRLHLGQLRLIVLDAALGESGEVLPALRTLSGLPDMRMAAVPAVTQEDVPALMAALQPGSGTRLSKALDVLAETRQEQGVIPAATLSDVIRMGERQSPVLPIVRLDGESVELLGGWPVDGQGRLTQPLTAGDMQLLSLMQGRVKTLRLTEAEAAEVREISARTRLSGSTAHVKLTLRMVRGPSDTKAMEAMLARQCLALMTDLYASGCDVLGLGRQAVRSAEDWAQWKSLAWPERLGELRWTVSVRVQPGT